MPPSDARADDPVLAQVPFGRNRLLTGLGGVLVAFAVRAFVPE